ncbi:hypothetical protein M9H77_03341 [Catharanthus roseus]|uniref:Uncharacterized protein n=1 Tax=Catharanthus roseus TaxID=4058 RepID=A0ACC0CBD9_CATRO|nr:hypothetical protein M9H77_03341 [Catharanthus roseus]
MVGPGPTVSEIMNNLEACLPSSKPSFVLVSSMKTCKTCNKRLDRLVLPLDIYLNMEDEVHHMRRMQQALKRLEQQLSLLAKGVMDLKREEEINYEQTSGRVFGGLSINDSQWGYGNFSPHTRSYEYTFYDCYEDNRLRTRNGYNGTSCKRVSRNDARNSGNYVNMDGMFLKEKVIMRDMMIVITMDDIIIEEVLKLLELHQDLLVTII